ncbi:MAG TPA: SpoIIE family protein phosphatase [Silvibacterium sp.]|nr:SpoIIE family protein phosphatase [Silvibacterium sp.]
MKKRKRARKETSPNLLRAMLVLYALASLGYWLAGSLDRWQVLVHWDQRVAQPFRFDLDTHVLESTRPEAVAAGLHNGDRIDGFNGGGYTGLAQLAEVLVDSRPGDVLDVEYTRANGPQKTCSITLARADYLYHDKSPVLAFWQEFFIVGLLSLTCLGIGFWVVLVKPREPTAWLLLVLLTFPSVTFLDPGLATGFSLMVRSLWRLLIQVSAAPALLLFGVYFPERSRLDVRAPWIKWIILGVLGVCLVIFIPSLYKEYYAGGDGPLLTKLSDVASTVTNYLDLFCVFLYLALTLDKLRSASTEDARRRLRVLSAGVAVGMGALILVYVVLPHFGINDQDRKHYWVRYLGATIFMVAPLTLAYVVLVQRAMDVRAILRMGSRYLLAKAFLFVVQIALITVAMWRLLLPVLNKKELEASDFIGVLVFFGLVLALRLGFHKRMQAWIDRKFFREAYNAEVVLNELSDEVRHFTETAPLLETVARRVAETLHIDQIAMMLRRGEIFQLQQSIGVTVDGTLTLPAQASAVRYLAATNEPARLYRDDPDAWYLMAGTGERHVLDLVNAELLLPLPGRNRLMGLMALGPKRSEAAYTPADLHLLQTVATQTGLAIEVAELARSLATEAAQRERVNREIEIAREVQERLFPQEMPTLPGATLAGACRPALGVGGDYYDVFDLGEERTGLAIGDVSGKGISAALLMASLRASLRGVTLDSPRDFAKLMDKVNRLVFEASASNRYATFFFAAFDPMTRRLECVNAGHNPPILLRTGLDGKTQTLRLEADGPVVGLLPAAPYTEQAMTLVPGDLLLLYTDGISEAMTHDDEEWGEERLIKAAEKVKSKPACEILRALFDAADAFTAGAPQHDDMTLLVLKLEG